MRQALPLAILAAALAACGKSDPPSLQGYIEGEYVRVAAPFAGTLLELQTARGNQVEAGTPLFVLEQENEDAARREAAENVRKAEAQAENLRKGPRATELETSRAQLAQARTTAGNSEREWKRQLDLVSKGFVSQSVADAAKTTRDRDHDKVVELESALATLESGSRPDEIRAAEAEAAAAKQSLAQADWKLKQKTVASTVAGVVNDTLFVRGEWVPAGAPVVSVLPPANVKARFFVPETELGRVKVGQAVKLACDGCGAPVDAKVSFIAPQAEFTPPVIYSRDSRAKLVFLVEARPAPADAGKLHPGQPVDVTLP
ncbi:MAG TPA: HlyD family efflux transporter periplasmic adaptor subunit [Usitatibacter sp.]|nr:HlyD family efflux transporter periplasmic adaptor subunit [Usitatibacter sp.]